MNRPTDHPPTPPTRRPGGFRLLIGAVAALIAAWPGPAATQEVVAVLSSELGPYQQAFEGFRQALDQPVPVVSLSAGEPRIGSRTRVVVAFGSLAAAEQYPDAVTLVYCMAPGTGPSQSRRPGTAVRVAMLPAPAVLGAQLRRIQPGLRRLAVPWILASMQGYIEEVAAQTDSLELVAMPMEDIDQLPDRLRGLAGRRADAIWLPPDPLLINPQSFSILKQFSWANDVPLFAPTAGFVSQGAVAAVAVPFAGIGRAAAAAARQALRDDAVPPVVYPDGHQIFLNATAAAECGLDLPEPVVSDAVQP